MGDVLRKLPRFSQPLVIGFLTLALVILWFQPSCSTESAGAAIAMRAPEAPADAASGGGPPVVPPTVQPTVQPPQVPLQKSARDEHFLSVQESLASRQRQEQFDLIFTQNIWGCAPRPSQLPHVHTHLPGPNAGAHGELQLLHRRLCASQAHPPCRSFGHAGRYTCRMLRRATQNAISQPVVHPWCSAVAVLR